MVSKPSQKIRRMFGSISHRYDLLNGLLSGHMDSYWRWFTTKQAPPQSGLPILDVASGTGDLAIAYSKRADATTPIIASDFCHPMLTVARDKLVRKGLDTRIEVVEADGLSLPFETGSFDIVSIAFGLRNMEDTQAGLEEMIRVLRPGGRLVVLEFGVPRRKLFRAFYLWYFKNILPRIGQLVAPNKEAAYSYLPASVLEFPYGEQMLELLGDCGLQECRESTLTFGIASLYIGHKPERAVEAVPIPRAAVA